MLSIFKIYIENQLAIIKHAKETVLLSEQAVSGFSDCLADVAERVTNSTVTNWIVQEVTPENPFAAFTLDLMTNEQREKAKQAICDKIAHGKLTIPEPLISILNLRFKNLTEAFLEMLQRMSEHQEEICQALLNGNYYHQIENILFSAGDTHNHGRTVMILETDAGKLVYKPHDMRGEQHIYELADRYFSDVMGIPKCIAFEDKFGVCEFIEKQRSEGEVAAKLFYHRLGGTAAIMKMLGSSDMHIENVTCYADKPYILDLETIISPEIENMDYRKLHPELWKLKSSSPYLSCLLPNESKGRQYSILVNTDNDGCAPVVNGKYVPVNQYLSEFLEGYHSIYQQILKKRNELMHFVKKFSSQMPVRLLIRNTQYYFDTIQRLYHHHTLSSPENCQKTSEVLFKIMNNNIRSEFSNAVKSEIQQMQRGDIPYVYTYADSEHLYSDGKIVAESIFQKTAAQHILDTLSVMGEKDEAFDLALLERSILQYPAKLDASEQDKQIFLHREERILSREQALQEAENLFKLVYDLHIASPEGKLFWGYINESDFSFRFCETGLTNGLMGIAVFSAACAFVSENDQIKQQAEKIVNEIVIELNRTYDYLKAKNFSAEHAPFLGESDGVGGILTGLALLKRYTDRTEIAELQKKTLDTVSHFALSNYGAPDRMIGMSGFVSALCRFEEYHNRKELIKQAADSLLAMQTLKFQNRILWKSFPDTDRPISGGGHGIAGIAEALSAAANILHEDAYLPAIAEALQFERDSYSTKFGTWSDLRSYPPTGYMHGYCSGAPGIGIMLNRMKQNNYTSSVLEECAALAFQSVNKLPFNYRDHLCCGNAAVVEYYLSVGNQEEAGKLLSAMQKRCEESGNYRYMGNQFHNSVTASLFYGASGIGYEMLRYAEPDKILSVL